MSLSDEDKQWLRGELGHLRGEVVEHVERVRSDLVEQVERVRSDLVEHVEHVRSNLIQYVRSEAERVETSLLTEFHKWASPVEMRQRSHSAVLRAMDMEVESGSERVKKLEEGSDSRSQPEQGS